MNTWDDWINQAVECLKWYIKTYHLKSVVLGLSGGIDSTVSACICYLATKDNPECTFIGRSLPIKNSDEEISIASKLGQVICDDYQEVIMTDFYHSFADKFYIKEEEMHRDNISNGNIMARLRMMYLYQLAYLYKGIVIDTDNKTEHMLGFYTVHGDVGDYNVGISNLYKHEIYQMAEVLKNYVPQAKEVLEASIAIAPTDGNTGGTDMDQIAPGSTYEVVDEILDSLDSRIRYKEVIKKYGVELVDRIESRCERNYYKDEIPITLRPMLRGQNRN